MKDENEMCVEKEALNWKKKDGAASTRAVTKDGVTFLVFPLIEETGAVRHAFSTRIGGESGGIFSSMNLGFGRGDPDENVRGNFKRISSAVGFDCRDMVFSDQTHTVNIRKITEEDRGNGFTRPKSFFDVDGLVTDVPGLVLTTFYADCVPLFFVDPVRRCIGLSHSGRKGTAGKIGKLTVERMSAEYGSDPADIVAAVGPSICRDCYEVGPEVADEFKAAFGNDASRILLKKEAADSPGFGFHGINEKGSAGDKYLLDLWRANEIILVEAGIKREHLAVTDVCTACNSRLLFSHRASGGKRGSLAAFLELLP